MKEQWTPFARQEKRRKDGLSSCPASPSAQKKKGRAHSQSAEAAAAAGALRCSHASQTRSARAGKAAHNPEIYVEQLGNNRKLDTQKLTVAKSPQIGLVRSVCLNTNFFSFEKYSSRSFILHRVVITEVNFFHFCASEWSGSTISAVDNCLTSPRLISEFSILVFRIF